MRTRSLVGALLLHLALAGAATAQQEEVRHLRSSPDAPFSQIVVAGNTVYLAGMLGTVPGAGLAPGGIRSETSQALENVRAALARVDATLDDLVRCTVYLADMAEWAAMNEVYLTFFPGNRPARSAVGVNGLARDARVEIECTAVIPGRPGG